MAEPHLLVQRLGPLLRLVVAVLAAWLLIQALVLRSGWYYRWAEPASTVGEVQAALRTAGKQHVPGQLNVLVLGDSRVNEGVSFPLANAVAGGRINLVRGAVAGASPRVWYYLLRKIDPQCDRFAGIVLTASFYAEGEMQDVDLVDRRLDLAYLGPLVGLRDLRDLPATFTDPDLQHRARRGIVLPMLGLREDIKRLFTDFDNRLETVRWLRQHGIASALNYPGRTERLPHLDLASGSASLPSLDAVPEASRPYIAADLKRLHTPTSEATETQTSNQAYLRHWFGRIAQHCESSKARLLLLQLPRGPYHAALAAPIEPSEGTRQLSVDYGFELITPEGLAALESPEFYFDGLHLNAAGRQRYSQSVGSALGRALNADGADQPAAGAD